MRTEQHARQHLARQHRDRRDVRAPSTSLCRAGMAGLAATAVLGSAAALPSPAAASGPGDSFGAPNVINGVHGKVTFSNDSATAQPGEPSHVNAPSGAPDLPDHSLWFQWKSPITGRVVFRTRGSDFDTVLAAYTGSSLTGLVKRADNDDTEFALPGGGVTPLQSQIGFAAVKGVVYRIAVDSFTGASAPADVRTGTVQLSWDANDDFANARRLPNSSILPRRVVGDNTGATTEAGEPSHAPAGAGGSAGSIWYTYQAPQKGFVTFATTDSDSTTLLAAYKGTKVGDLTQIAVSNAGGGGEAHVSLVMRAGEVVKIAVDGVTDKVDEGPVALVYGYFG